MVLTVWPYGFFCPGGHVNKHMWESCESKWLVPTMGFFLCVGECSVVVRVYVFVTNRNLVAKKLVMVRSCGTHDTVV